MGIPYYPISLKRQSKNPWREAQTLREIYSIIRRTSPHLVHNFTMKPTLYGSLAAQWAGVGAVLNTITGLGTVFVDEKASTQAIRLILRLGLMVALRHNNLHVTLQNPDDRATFLQVISFSPERAYLIRGSGVDVSVYTEQPWDSREFPTFVMASRMMWEKGVGEYVEASRQLRAKGSKARFILAGMPDEDHHNAIPMAQLQQWNDEGVVEWIGHCDDMVGLFRQAHIVILPTYYREGIPKVLIEAAATGRPIITTDMPGCREVVQHQKNGLLIAPQNVEELVKSMQWLADEPAYCQQLGRAGRVLVVENFSLSSVTKQTLAIYQQMGLQP